MKKFLCMILSTILLLSFCACKDNTNDVSDVEVIYDEEIIYEGDNLVSDYTSTKENTATQSEVSNVSSVESENPTSSDASSTVEQTKENIFHLNDSTTLENIKLNGRCDKTSNGINLNMAASAIEFNTDSTSVLLELNASADVYYTVMVDGEITEQHKAIENGGTNYIVVARGLSAGKHNIKFIRDSESRTDLQFTVVSLQFDDGTTLLTKDENKSTIEFLGDSLTSGYGNLVENGVNNSGALKYLSATKAYPFLVANKIGYDYRIVSMSGIALAKREGYPTFLDFYGLESYHLDRTTQKYASSNPEDVDIVIVNLGTNDIGAQMYNSASAESVKVYEQHFVNLITEIGYRKDAKIVFITGIWHKEPITAINRAISELKNLGFTNTYTLELKEYKSGGGAHPSSKEHQEIADILTKFLKDNGLI